MKSLVIIFKLAAATSSVNWWKKHNSCNENAIKEYYHADLERDSFNLDCSPSSDNGLSCLLTCATNKLTKVEMTHTNTEKIVKSGVFSCVPATTKDGQEKFIWKYKASGLGQKYKFSGCARDTCPSKSMKSYAAGVRTLVSIEQYESFQMGYIKIPRRDIEKKITSENLQKHGWTAVFLFEKPISGRILSGNGGKISVSASGKVVSVTSASHNRDLLSYSKDYKLYISIFFSESQSSSPERVNFENFEMKIYAGQFGNTQCLDSMSQQKSFGVLKESDWEVKSWSDTFFGSEWNLDRSLPIPGEQAMAWEDGSYPLITDEVYGYQTGYYKGMAEGALLESVDTTASASLSEACPEQMEVQTEKIDFTCPEPEVVTCPICETCEICQKIPINGRGEGENDIHPLQTAIYEDCNSQYNTLIQSGADDAIAKVTIGRNCSDSIETVEAVSEYLWCQGLENGEGPSDIASNIPNLYYQALNLGQIEAENLMINNEGNLCQQNLVDKCENMFKGFIGLALAFPTDGFDPIETYSRLNPICLGVLSMHYTVCSDKYCTWDGKFEFDEDGVDRCKVINTMGSIMKLDVCNIQGWVKA